jgi:hypothetical protein
MAERSFDPAKHIRKVNGGDYLEVKWRLVWLRTEYPDARIDTELINVNDTFALFRTRIDLSTGAMAMWKTKATVMIAKCAESLALRKAFPAETSGLYTAEEMGTRSDSVITIDAEVIDVGTGEIIEAPPVRAISHNNPATVPADFEPQQFRDNVVAESNRRYEERAPSWNAIYGPARTKGLLPVQVQALACKRYGLAKHSDMSADDMIDLAQYIEQTDADTLKQEAGA